jgi:hypothetical protein
MAQRNNSLCDLGALYGEVFVGPMSRRSRGVSPDAAHARNAPGQESQKQTFFDKPQPANVVTC